MSEMTTLAVESREGSGTGPARAVRREGLVPGIVYGADAEPLKVAMNQRALMRFLRSPGFFSQLFKIEVGGEAQRVIPREVQFHPVTDAPLHFDLMRVSAGTTIVIAIPVHFLNEETCKGLRAGGVLNVVRHDVELHCAVDAIPEYIEIDLTGFEIGDSIHFSRVTGADDLKPVITDRDFTVATIAAPSVAVAADDEEEEGEGEGEGEEEVEEDEG